MTSPADENPTQPLPPQDVAGAPTGPGPSDPRGESEGPAGGLHGAKLIAAALGLVLLGALPTYALTKASYDDDNHDSGEHSAMGHGHGKGHGSDMPDTDNDDKGSGGNGHGKAKGRFAPGPQGLRGALPPGLTMTPECLQALQGLRSDLLKQYTEGATPSPPSGQPFLTQEQRQRLMTACRPSAGSSPTPQASPGAVS